MAGTVDSSKDIGGRLCMVPPIMLYFRKQEESLCVEWME